jgi:hypothetical protein
LAAEEAGGESDLETQIDQLPLADSRAVQAFAPLRERLRSTRLAAMLEVSSTRIDSGQVFVRPQSALVLLATEAWDVAAVRAALGAAADGLWSHSGLGAGWRALTNASGGAQELNGLGRLVIAADGARLILGDSPDLVNALLSRRAQPPVAGAAYAAGWRHARELPNFERLMRLIDFPEIRALAPAEGARGREPMFYSENLASLGRVLQRLESASITAHDRGDMVRERLIYRVAP